MIQSKVLIVDDEDKLRKLLSRIIELEGFEVHQAENLKVTAKKLAQLPIDVVLCDVKLPDGNGVAFVEQIKLAHPAVEVILLTAYGNIPDGVQAIKNGAFDYITKGDDNNKILPLLYRALERVQINRSLLSQKKETTDEITGFDLVIGQSSALLAAIHLAKRVAPTQATVLLTGETGTGKEVFAQAIHRASTRGKQNFVAVNCSAFSKDLLESELFGHKAGSFTNATKDQKGLFEEAHQGTLFLDEIGEMPIELQAKLLRVLEVGEFLKIGETKPTKVDVRIIAATNRAFDTAIQAGLFREDLYYRLSVFEIHLPALKERKEDIPLLAERFRAQFATEQGSGVQSIAKEALEALQQYAWPGNIRALRNAMERAVILCTQSAIQLNDLPYEVQQQGIVTQEGSTALDLATVEKLHIQRVLQHTKGNKTKTAELLGIALTTLYRKMTEYEIQ
ncbi:sigma-54-dependent Fis family transcriptional regulator [Myroides sp. 1354]|uniref:sigma-54-dependent transcriptional regulator n=1 Tax=unclassified Myroides TaxID=2642485 RepID=UPI002574BF9E|nr:MULTISPECIES: sigma-54 dependent transcriptional regulator [unclassified Myroides]MDM1046457.1 sigma-54-dependent Fis family transcriptional regulator [Myroides sp. R163-1]MDM1057420.1 sigma-54-dependent Fis family transcriptional regulator [Myroides sp. 1354]MDM1070705.1 sigma-54-dependent Fis family transcriptional regulator [Myroides sp. 1372]